MGHVGGESVTFGLTRHWQTECHPPDSGCGLNQSTQQPRRTPQMVTCHRASVEDVH